MAGYKSPDFNERMAAARAAKERALDKLRNKPAPEPGVIAERQAARAARDAAAAERRAERQRAAEEAKKTKAAAKSPKPEAKGGGERSPAPALPTEAELKAARDARYAARKARKK
ncbi:MAG: DUF6481 family protein [Allosphingosinicella sp.]|uniref:DUF6481 family protein n=1 Tax=Allosphingosinicella sp. TaxID=2823234 RepID=UPI003920822F